MAHEAPPNVRCATQATSVEPSGSNIVPTLDRLPSEILGQIFSYLIPAELSTSSKAYSDHCTTHDCLLEIKDPHYRQPKVNKQTESNKLGFTCVNRRFYEIAHEQRALKYRTYTVCATAKSIFFEQAPKGTKPERSMSRLYNTGHHIHHLRVIFHVGVWGQLAHRNHLVESTNNFQRLCLFLDGLPPDRKPTKKDVFVTSWTGEGPGIPTKEIAQPPLCLQQFANQVGDALARPTTENLSCVLWWSEDDVSHGEGSEASNEDNTTRERHVNQDEAEELDDVGHTSDEGEGEAEISNQSHHLLHRRSDGNHELLG